MPRPPCAATGARASASTRAEPALAARPSPWFRSSQEEEVRADSSWRSPSVAMPPSSGRDATVCLDAARNRVRLSSECDGDPTAQVYQICAHVGGPDGPLTREHRPDTATVSACPSPSLGLTTRRRRSGVQNQTVPASPDGRPWPSAPPVGPWHGRTVSGPGSSPGSPDAAHLSFTRVPSAGPAACHLPGISGRRRPGRTGWPPPADRKR